jgi:hypothetical protein
LLLIAKDEGQNLKHACYYIYSKIKKIFGVNELIIPKEIGALFRLLESDVVAVEKLASRVFIVTVDNGKKYLYKYDEQKNANELTFLTSSLATYFGIFTPTILLLPRIDKIVDMITEIDADFEQPRNSTCQIIEYIEEWSRQGDLRIRDINKILPLDLGYDLGSLLAFNLFLGGGDQFLYLSRAVDNIIFKDDPDYTQMNRWGNPMINNLGIINNRIWSIDL